MAVLEAWSHGRPVLMTTACNLPEGAAAGAAIEVSATAPSIAEGLGRLGEMDESALERMGSAGLGLAAARFAWGRIASDMARVYESAVAGSGPPADLIYQDRSGDSG